MKSISKLVRYAVVSAVVLSLSASAKAETSYDHLKCFKAKDFKTFKKATADINVLSDHLAGLQNCTISAGAKEICIPVRKSNAVVEEGSDNGLAGPDLDDARLCYKLKCDTTEPGPQTYMDQFGPRSIDGFKVASICTPMVIGTLPAEPPPTWPATPQAYADEDGSYIDALTVPPIVKQCIAGQCAAGGAACSTNGDCYLGPTCCKDFGEISRDNIQASSNKIDNALAELAEFLQTFGINIQATLTSSIQDGSLVVLLDHRDLDATLPDQFVLAQLIGSFAPGTTYTEASAGTGQFIPSAASFVSGGTGEPRNWYQPAIMTSTSMTAGPFAISLSLPFGFLTLNVSAEQAEASGTPTISPGGVAYSDGELSGFILTDDIYGNINALLNSATCTCLGHTEDIYFKDGTGAWTTGAGASNRCVANAGTACPNPGQEACVTLGGDGSPLASPPQICTALPGILGDAADIDLNSNPSVYEGFSVGLKYTAKNAQILGAP